MKTLSQWGHTQTSAGPTTAHPFKSRQVLFCVFADCVVFIGQFVEGRALTEIKIGLTELQLTSEERKPVEGEEVLANCTRDAPPTESQWMRMLMMVERKNGEFPPTPKNTENYARVCKQDRNECRSKNRALTLVFQDDKFWGCCTVTQKHKPPSGRQHQTEH